MKVRPGSTPVKIIVSGAQGPAGAVDLGSLASTIHGATAKTTPANADEFAIVDSAASNVLKKLTFANLKATILAGVSNAWADITGKPAAVTSLMGTNTGDQTSIVGITGTKAQFQAAMMDDDFVTLTGDQTIAAKTFNGGIYVSNGTETVPPKIISDVGAGVTAENAVLTGGGGTIVLSQNSDARGDTLHAGAISGATTVSTGATWSYADATAKTAHLTALGTSAYTPSAVAITGGTATGLTSFGIRSTGAAFDLTMATSEVLTAGRTLSWNVGNAARTITLSGNPTMGDWFDQSVKTTATPTFGASLSLVNGANTSTWSAAFGNFTAGGDVRSPVGDFSTIKLGNYSAGNSPFFERDAAHTAGQRNGTNPQTYRLYGTYTSNSNQEMLEVKSQSAGSFLIQSIKGSGGGTARDIEFRHGGTNTAGTITNGTLIMTATSTGVTMPLTLAVTGATTLTGGSALGTKTVGTLPTASSNTYLEFVVTDSLAPAVGSTVAAGGSAKCKVISNGTNWIVSTVL